MILTLTTNPVAGTSQIFAGFEKIEFIFKREDIAITSVTSGTGGAKISHSGDLTSYLSAGDTIYFYSEATNMTYDTSATILSIIAGEITVDEPYIETGGAGYMNYFKNYYVELQCVNPDNTDVNLLPFSLESDGDAAGNITIDVSIMNDLNAQRGIIAKEHLSDSVQIFQVKYRQVYDGSSESFIELTTKTLIVLYCTDTPESEEIINDLDLPKIYLGYPVAFCVAHYAGDPGETVELTYNEKDINNNNIASGTLGTLNAGLNGFLLWEWDKDTSVDSQTKYIDFEFEFEATFDFADPDFAYPDFVTQ